MWQYCLHWKKRKWSFLRQMFSYFSFFRFLAKKTKNLTNLYNNSSAIFFIQNEDIVNTFFITADKQMLGLSDLMWIENKNEEKRSNVFLLFNLDKLGFILKSMLPLGWVPIWLPHTILKYNQRVYPMFKNDSKWHFIWV